MSETSGTLNPDLPIDRQPMSHGDLTVLRFLIADRCAAVGVDVERVERTSLRDLAEALFDADPDGTVTRRGTYVSARVKLRPIEPADYGVIYRASLLPRTAHQWRFRGRTPSPEQFQQALFANVLAQFAIADTERGEVIGVCAAHEEMLDAGHCKVSVLRCLERSGEKRTAELAGAVFEGLGLFLGYLFRNWTLKKVFFEVPEFNASIVHGLAPQFLTEEAILRDYLYFDERTWDLTVYSLTRERWWLFVDGLGLSDA